MTSPPFFFQIVVARYCENVDWLTQHSRLAANLLIYDKNDSGDDNKDDDHRSPSSPSPSPSPPPPVAVVRLPNVGRESDTYLRYIIAHYSALPEVVVFTQANIEDHFPKKNCVFFLLRLLNEALVHGKSLPVCRYLHRPDRFDPHNYHFSPTFNYSARSRTFFLQDNYLDNTPTMFETWFRTHIQSEYPNPISVYCHGLFAVRRELVLNRPLAFYERLLKQVSHHVNPAEGHFVERSWFYIFQ